MGINLFHPTAQINKNKLLGESEPKKGCRRSWTKRSWLLVQPRPPSMGTVGKSSRTFYSNLPSGSRSHSFIHSFMVKTQQSSCIMVKNGDHKNIKRAPQDQANGPSMYLTVALRCLRVPQDKTPVSWCHPMHEFYNWVPFAVCKKSCARSMLKACQGLHLGLRTYTMAMELVVLQTSGLQCFSFP